MSDNIKILTDRSDIVAIADAVRSKTGTTAEMTLGGIITGIHGIQTGVDLPALTNEGTAADMLSGKQLIDSDGNVVTGNIPTITQATPSISVNSNGLITASATQTAGYIVAGTKSTTKQLTTQSAKTITPSTLDQVAISSGVYATGAVTVKGDANLVAANIVSGKSIFGVNGTAEVGSGSGNTDIEDSLITRTVTTYTNDRVTNIGEYAFYKCSSLTTASFPVCTSIGMYAFDDCSGLTTISFPVCTSMGNDAFYKCSSLTTASFPVCTSIGNNTFYYCTSLTTVSFPVCTSIGNNAFYNCTSLTTASFPKCTSIGMFAFESCSSLTTASFPVCTSIGNNAFVRCSSLTTASFPKCTIINRYAFSGCTSLITVSLPKCITIYSNAFSGCTSLSALILGNSSRCTLSASNAFTSTPIASGTGYIYVPASLVSSYKTATNWTFFSAQISAIEDSEFA